MLRPSGRLEYLPRHPMCHMWAKGYSYPGSMLLLPTGSYVLPASQWPPTRQPKGRQECLIYKAMGISAVKPKIFLEEEATAALTERP